MSELKSLPRSIPVVIHAGVTQADVEAGEAKYPERTVKVAKLPLGKAAALSVAFRGIGPRIQELREHAGLRDLLDNEENQDLPLNELAFKLVDFLPEILEVAADTVIDILAAGTGISSDELREVGLDEAAELFAAVVTVNNLGAVQSSLKNALRRLGLGSRTPETKGA